MSVSPMALEMSGSPVGCSPKAKANESASERVAYDRLPRSLR